MATGLSDDDVALFLAADTREIYREVGPITCIRLAAWCIALDKGDHIIPRNVPLPCPSWLKEPVISILASATGTSQETPFPILFC